MHGCSYSAGTYTNSKAVASDKDDSLLKCDKCKDVLNGLIHCKSCLLLFIQWVHISLSIKNLYNKLMQFMNTINLLYAINNKLKR